MRAWWRRWFPVRVQLKVQRPERCPAHYMSPAGVSERCLWPTTDHPPNHSSRNCKWSTESPASSPTRGGPKCDRCGKPTGRPELYFAPRTPWRCRPCDRECVEIILRTR